MKTFIDLAWVYEHIFSDLRYKGLFVDTSSYMDFYAMPQRSNFAKASLGLSVLKQDVGVDLIYSVLVSTGFLEQTANINFFKKF